jgi:hypothetical protein
MRRRLATAIAFAALATPASAWGQAPPPGLVAAYSFDEGSGALLHDTSGNGHTGTVANAAWTGGRHASALSFNGVDAHVDLGALGTF